MKPHIIVALSFLLPCTADAASQTRCLEIWKAADVDANGALDSKEDTAGYIAAASKSGAKIARSDALSRDEFLTYCSTKISDADGASKNEPAANTESGTAPKDLGKGDITPGTKPLEEAEARKRLEANGYRELGGMKLDERGVWSAETTVNGKRVTVRIDQQGDIVSQ